MLHNSDIILLVGLTEFGKFSPNRVVLWITDNNAPFYFSNYFSSKIIAAKINKCRFIDNETPYERVPKGHPTIVDYFYHEEVKGTGNTGKRKVK